MVVTHGCISDKCIRNVGNVNVIRDCASWGIFVGVWLILCLLLADFVMTFLWVYSSLCVYYWQILL